MITLWSFMKFNLQNPTEPLVEVGHGAHARACVSNSVPWWCLAKFDTLMSNEIDVTLHHCKLKLVFFGEKGRWCQNTWCSKHHPKQWVTIMSQKDDVLQANRIRVTTGLFLEAGSRTLWQTCRLGFCQHVLVETMEKWAGDTEGWSQILSQTCPKPFKMLQKLHPWSLTEKLWWFEDYWLSFVGPR